MILIVETFAARRKGDLVISLVWNNDDKVVSILGANNALLLLLSYSSSELEGQPFFNLITELEKSRIVKQLKSEEDALDIETLLARTKRLSLKTKYGAIIPVKIKIFPSSSTSSKESRCEILAREYSCLDYLIDFRRENSDFEHSMDEMLRIMDAQSTSKEFVLLSQFCQQHKQSCIVGLLQLSNTSKIAIRNAIEELKKVIRHTDQIGIIEEVLVIFIIGCRTEMAEKPMSRIMKEIRKSDKNATISYFNLLEHPTLDPKSDFFQQKRMPLKII